MKKMWEPTGISKAVKILLIFVLASLILPSISHALSLREALDKAAIYFTKTAVRIDPSNKMVIQVVNYHSQQQDTEAREIETELYFALERQFPKFKLVLLSEALAGVSDREAVFVKGTYEKEGEKTIVRLQAIKGSLTGIILAQIMVGFEAKKVVHKTLVAVLDIEADDLNPNQKKAYSEIFRSELIQIGAFDLASSGDIDKLNPDAIQKTTGCTRDECATIIGEQLGVDRVIASYLFKLEENNYVLSGKMIDIKDGAILGSITINHHDNLDSLPKSIKKLAARLSESDSDKTPPKRLAQPVSQKAKLTIYITPLDSLIKVDGVAVAEKVYQTSTITSDTRTYSLSLPLGKHIIRATHPNALRSEEKTVTLSKKGKKYSVSFDLEMNSQYIQEQQYVKDMSSWRWKWITCYLGSILVAGYASTESAAAAKSLEEQQSLRLQAISAPSLAAAEEYNNQAKEENEKVISHNQNMKVGALASVLLFGLATWIWIDEPENPKAAIWQTKVSPNGKIALNLKLNW